MNKAALEHKTWTKDDYIISTDPSLIPLTKLNDIFASEEVYWAKSLPESVLLETLQNSLCFGVYHTSHNQHANGAEVVSEAVPESSGQLTFVGIGRCITDFTTFLYLTDVYIYPELQGRGLGGWLVRCVQEVVESMPHLRRSLAFTGDWERSVPFYEKLMGMSVIESRRSSDGKSGEGLAVLMRKGKGNPGYVEDRKET